MGMAADPLRGRGHPLVRRGNRSLLVLGDGLQFRAVGTKRRDAGEVVTEVVVDVKRELRCIQPMQHVILERRLARLLLRLALTVEVQGLEASGKGLNVWAGRFSWATTQATASRTSAAVRQ